VDRGHALAKHGRHLIFCVDTPVSHCSVGPSPSSQPKYASLALNLPSVAAFAGAFSRSTPDRPVTGSATSRPANLARAPGSARIRAPTWANTPVLNSVRTAPAILSNVE
jgi:hypothetical protein